MKALELNDPTKPRIASHDIFWIIPQIQEKRLMNLKHFHLFYFCSPDDKRASDSILHLFDAGVHVLLRDIWRI